VESLPLECPHESSAERSIAGGILIRLTRRVGRDAELPGVDVFAFNTLKKCPRLVTMVSKQWKYNERDRSTRQVRLLRLPRAIPDAESVAARFSAGTRRTRGDVQSRKRRRTVRTDEKRRGEKTQYRRYRFSEGESSAPGTRISISIKQPLEYRPDDAAVHRSHDATHPKERFSQPISPL